MIMVKASQIAVLIGSKSVSSSDCIDCEGKVRELSSEARSYLNKINNRPLKVDGKASGHDNQTLVSGRGRPKTK